MRDAIQKCRIQAIDRPNKELWTYYLLCAAIVPPAFPIVSLILYFRYHTMRYAFTNDGISMSWGILFQRQILINYARVQDIHLRSNVVERWLGLSRILVQTASGSQSAEMIIEGIKEFEALRDFLYERMRGVKDHHPVASSPVAPTDPESHASDELTVVLRDVARELRAVREALAAKSDRTEGRT